MANFGKTAAALLFVFALAKATNNGNDCDDCNDCGDCVNVEPLIKLPNFQKMPPRSLEVNYPASYITPLKYTANDYSGPYDPMDPEGASAARHRAMKMSHDQNLEEFKSYIPEGLGEFIKKQVIKLLVGEGKRFAFAHPKETGQILDIIMKAKKLYQTTSKNVDKLDKGDQKGDEC